MPRVYATSHQPFRKMPCTDPTGGPVETAIAICIPIHRESGEYRCGMIGYFHAAMDGLCAPRTWVAHNQWKGNTMATKQEIIETIQQGNQRVTRTFGVLTEEQLNTQVHFDPIGWNAGQLLAHLA